MELTDLRKMRGKQIAVTNGLILTLLTIYFVMISVLDVTFSVLFLILGISILIQAILGFLKSDSTKSFIPIFEQVANYEKQKMGREWNKQRRMGFIWNLILSGLMFMQYYFSRGSTDHVFQIDFTFMFVITLIALGLINISLFLHIRKVDRSTSELDMKGYTWKSSLVAVVVGVVLAVASIAFIMFYILSNL
ncbi:hypothetical protein [Virgibacillus sp. DJP39]|uniref:hypothetical protein n=1 Tax=Virgibacillus sp. DJP39 TaxID=3409790 RepID=UPI003BB52881